MSKRKKPRGKVKLPRDRHGTPIDVGDVLSWGDGTLCKVDTLTYLGEEFADTVGSWVVNIEDEYFDNPQGGEVIRKGKR